MAKTDDTPAAEATEAPTPSIALVEVTLTKPHQHGAEVCKPGDKIKVNRRQYQWLAARGRIKA